VVQHEIQIGVEIAPAGSLVHDRRIEPRHSLFPKIGLAAVIVFGAAPLGRIAEHDDHLEFTPYILTYRRKIDVTADDQISFRSVLLYQLVNRGNVRRMVAPAQIAGARTMESPSLKRRNRTFQIE